MKNLKKITVAALAVMMLAPIAPMQAAEAVEEAAVEIAPFNNTNAWVARSTTLFSTSNGSGGVSIGAGEGLHLTGASHTNGRREVIVTTGQRAGQRGWIHQNDIL